MLEKLLIGLLVALLLGSTTMMATALASGPQCDNTVPKEVPCPAVTSNRPCQNITSSAAACNGATQKDAYHNDFTYITVAGSQTKAIYGGDADCFCLGKCEWQPLGRTCGPDLHGCVPDTLEEAPYYVNANCIPSGS